MLMPMRWIMEDYALKDDGARGIADVIVAGEVRRCAFIRGNIVYLSPREPFRISLEWAGGGHKDLTLAELRATAPTFADDLEYCIRTPWTAAEVKES